MKKTILSILSLSVSLGMLAQSNNLLPKANIDVEMKSSKKADGSEVVSGPFATAPMTRAGTSSTVIGNTVYDLQTNGTSQRRIINHNDGTVSATWTMDNGSSPYANRGAGYNYKSTSAWGSLPSSKVETTRNGWPALASGAVNANEFIVSHSGTGGLTLNKRNIKGTGAWSESVIPTTIPSGYDVLWPRAVVGGSKDSTLHVIGIVRHSTTGGPAFKGLTNALVYYRSKNLGGTWDIQDSILPGLDSSFFSYVSADAYSIDARGDVVAIASYNSWGDVLVFKSTNNGNSWTKTIVNDFPINKYVIDDGSDANGDGSFDTILSCDGSGSMMIDNSGSVHVFYGLSRVLDSDTTDGNTSYFPGTNGLAYWNEGFGADSTQVITGALDLDGTGALEVVPSGGSFPSYQVGLSSMPSCGISTNNTLYLVYSAMAETHSNGVQVFRHLYVMNSYDGGATWSNPEDYTPDFEFAIYEAVYPSMAKHVDSAIHIVYQRDFEPGQSVSGDTDPAAIQDIVYLNIDTALNEQFASINEKIIDYNVTLFPNPTNDILNVRVLTQTSVNDNVTISLIDALGRTVNTIGDKFIGKSAQFSMNVSELKNGIYFVRIQSESGIITKSFVKK
ncbi:T9SS type A sorting domain-containing protein [Flavobacteriales bacterium]|nr:T9SS type A sorting domain-containing protein [Flavobacteriales bacterium]